MCKSLIISNFVSFNHIVAYCYKCRKISIRKMIIFFSLAFCDAARGAFASTTNFGCSEREVIDLFYFTNVNNNNSVDINMIAAIAVDIAHVSTFLKTALVSRSLLIILVMV